MYHVDPDTEFVKGDEAQPYEEARKFYDSRGLDTENGAGLVGTALVQLTDERGSVSGKEVDQILSYWAVGEAVSAYEEGTVSEEEVVSTYNDAFQTLEDPEHLEYVESMVPDELSVQ